MRHWQLFNSDANTVISAPTGSGKTALMELAMLRQFMHDAKRTRKIVYISPSKALCRERSQDWSSKLQLLFRKCVEITGDSEVSDNLKDVDLIVTTPEKWDSITRKWSDHKSFLSCVSLLIVPGVSKVWCNPLD